MRKLFIYLPIELKIKILLSIPSWKIPKPKFKKDDIVEFRQEEKINIWFMIYEYSNISNYITNSPYNKLKVISLRTDGIKRKRMDLLYRFG